MPAPSLRRAFAAAVLVLAALAAPATSVSAARAATSTEAPANTVDEPGDANVMCCDGTESPTCTVKKRGCCSHHGGVCG
jgi:siroheme synthase (precorrin-2 oxidase/ferrochelatase)